MDITIYPKKLRGDINAIPSKSQAHRLLICAAFADRQTVIICPETNKDIDATVACLRALGAKVLRQADRFIVEPITDIPATAVLPCAESGSTLRFLLPISGALGVDTTFCMEGRLPLRPLSPLWEEMERMGCCLIRPSSDTIRCTGRLHSGKYSISGSVSSQFITGLIFATALLDGDSELTVTGKIESRPYIDMTLQALASFGISHNGFNVCGKRPFVSPSEIRVEGDWSNAAFFLAAKALGSDLNVSGLRGDSSQGDRAAATLFDRLRENITICAADIPDLVPILSVVAAANQGAVFTDIQRLRLKESDRVASVIDMLCSLGVCAEANESTLTVHPGVFRSGTVDAVNDHRIAMSAAIAATAAQGPVTIIGAECVAKSYPFFWDEYRRLGGSYEQHIRK